MNSRLAGIALLTGASVFFGTIPIFATSLSRSGVGAWLQVAARLGVSALIFAAAITLTTRRVVRLPARAEWFFPVVNGVLVLAAFASYIIAISLGVTPAKAVLITYLYPAVSAILGGIFLREALTRRKIAAIGIGLVGVAITLEVWSIEGLSRFGWGEVLIFLNAFFSGALVTFGRWGRSHKQIAPMYLTLWSFGVGLALMLALAGMAILLGGGEYVSAQLVFDGGDPALPLGLLGLAILGTAIPYLMMYTGLGRVPSNIAGILLLPEVISVFLFSALFLRQHITLWQLVGGAIILSASLLISE